MMEARRVLVIDDEPDFAGLVVKVAAGMGYAATAAATAKDFRRLYLAAPPPMSSWWTSSCRMRTASN
jgi:CheY-like chemotaxis protein